MPQLQFSSSDWSTSDQALQREWLVTNGLGGWAAGTLGGANTRRYHGVLVAALRPPVDRRVLVSKLDDWAAVAGTEYPLTTNEFADGTVDPQGWKNISQVMIENGLPTWRYAVGGAVLDKSVFMPYGHNATWTVYHYVSGSAPLSLRVTPLLNHRDFHFQTTQAPWAPVVDSTGPSQLKITLYPGAHPVWLVYGGADFRPGTDWIRGLHFRVEQGRGLPSDEDVIRLGSIAITLQPGEEFAVLVSAEAPDPEALTWPTARRASENRQKQILQLVRLPSSAPDWVRQLAIAADQFVVGRTDGANAPATAWRTPLPETDRTVIAGYPWFSDWGRDTMIALPGLTLATGRFPEAAAILRTFARYVDHGMLPNRFPDTGEAPEYNTVDATLWYFHAIDRYAVATGDFDLIDELLPVLEDIMRWHRQGTRYGIRCEEDGLLRAGESGAQLTWMDAKIGDWVVTPRTGKPVEINALWINALRAMARFVGRRREQSTNDYTVLAEKALGSFNRFWNETAGCLYDVLDTPHEDGHDSQADGSIRPNQLLAVSLPYAPLGPTDPRAKAVVDVCHRQLFTPVGLRSLSPNAPEFAPHFRGGPRERDSVYHQGTVWGWLIGPFVEAHFKVYADRAASSQLLDGLAAAMSNFGIGTLAEVYDATEPFVPGGCFAQAWSVSEALRVWRLLNS